MKTVNFIYILVVSLFVSFNLKAQEGTASDTAVTSATDYPYNYLKNNQAPRPLKQQAENAYNSGMLTDKEKKKLDKKFDKLENVRTKAQADGNLTDKEKAKLSKLRTDIKESLQNKRTNNKMNTNKAIESIEARLKAGIADGSITEAEAKKLNEMLVQVKGIQTRGDESNSKKHRKKLTAAIKETNQILGEERKDTGVSCVNLSPADCRELKTLSQKYNQ